MTLFHVYSNPFDFSETELRLIAAPLYSAKDSISNVMLV